MTEKTSLEEFKKSGNPYAQLSVKLDVIAEQSAEIVKQNEIKIKLLDRLCTLKEDFQEVWFKSSNKKFKVSIVGIMATGAVLYIDILKLNPDSVIVSSVVNLIDAFTRLF